MMEMTALHHNQASKHFWRVKMKFTKTEIEEMVMKVRQSVLDRIERFFRLYSSLTEEDYERIKYDERRNY